MKTDMIMKCGNRLMLALAVGLLALATAAGRASDKKADTQPAAARVASQPATQIASEAGMEDLNKLLKLPMAVIISTPQIVQIDYLEATRKGPRPKFLVPAGVKNVAEEKKVTSSDKDPTIGELKCITDGCKETGEGRYVELSPGLQWVQIDLEKEYKIYAVVVWHFHGMFRAYKNVAVQISNDSDFIEKTTVFNSDHENTSGLGVGKDMVYLESYEGKIIDGKAATGRYVRLYSRGNSANDSNHYTEVEVYALPAK